MELSEILTLFNIVSNENGCNILSVYISGSYANGYFLDGISDLDLLLLVDNPPPDFSDQLLKKTENKNVELDLCVLAVNDLYNKSDSTLVRECVLSSKLCGKLIWGEDLLADWQLPSIEDYTQRTIEMVFDFIRRAHGRSCDLNHLECPDKSDQYNGYLVMRNGVLSTKQIISLYTWIATALLAQHNGIYCGCKKQCIELSLKYLEDDFTSVLLIAYEYCRKKWKYMVPSDPEEQRLLKKLCSSLLKYEQKFVKDFCEERIAQAYDK